MNRLQQMRRLKEYLQDYHESELEEHRDYQKRRTKMHLQLNTLMIRKKELKKRLRLLKRYPNYDTSQEQSDLSDSGYRS